MPFSGRPYLYPNGTQIMGAQLQGKKILIITSNSGIERDELIKPLETLRGFGATVTHASSKGGPI
jgi:protease I